jgi:uncharacterized protein (TIGR03435 family)
MARCGDDPAGVRKRVWLLIATLCVADVRAQQPAFTAASVKPNTTNGAGLADVVLVRPGQLLAQYATLRELVQAAYGVEQNQVADGPGWLDTAHFEVNAVVPNGTAISDVQAMLQSLLKERFGLVTRREQRDLPVYVLEYLGRPGPSLRVAGAECRPVSPPPGLPMPPPPPPPPPAGTTMTLLNQPKLGGGCPSMFFTGHMSARNVPVSLLVFQLSRLLRRQVLDHTALTGRYDWDLTFTPDAGAAQLSAAGAIGGGPGALAVPSPEAPALATALREQLGLRLEASRAPIDVVAIERVTAPTQN